MVRAGSLVVLLSLLKNASSETIGAAIAALRNLSIHDRNAVCILICAPQICMFLCSMQVFFCLIPTETHYRCWVPSGIKSVANTAAVS